MKYDIVIFDLDGTILNTLDDLHDSLNRSLSLCGYKVRTLSEVRAFVGNGIYNLIVRALPDGTCEDEIKRVNKAFTDDYKVHCFDKTRPYEGISGVIKAVANAGCRIAVISNKDDYAVRALCERFFPGLIDCAVGTKPDIKKKPAPDSALAVISALGGSVERTVIIGDSDVDIMTAENAKMKCISVLWGFRDRNFLEKNGATTLVETPRELIPLIT